MSGINKQAALLQEADSALKAAAEYVAATQPVIDDYNVFKAEFVKRSHQVAGGLASIGIIPAYEANKLADKLAEDPMLALDLVEKVAAMVTPEGFGATANDVKAAASVDLDPFERLALYGDATADPQAINSGMVE